MKIKLKKIKLTKLLKLEHLEKRAIFALAFCIFLISNILVSNISFRFDASAGKAYTLSDSSRQILEGLNDIVNIRFFASADLPARLQPLKTDVGDILSEYKKAGGSKIQIKVIDPKKDPNAGTQAREAGIPELQFSQLESDKYAITTAYFGISLNYGDKQEVIPQVTDFENLEYNLTSSIYKLTRKELVKIGILGRSASASQTGDSISSLSQTLNQQFSQEEIDLSSEEKENKIDPSIKTVFVFDNNTKEYEKNETDMLKKYLNNKGKAIFFLDGVWVADSLTTSSANHNLYSLLEEYGITMEKNLVLSASAELVNFGNNEVSLLVPYPFWLRVNNFYPGVSYFSNINQLVFPWSSNLKLTKKPGVETKELAKTSQKSWIQKDNFELNPQAIQPPADKDLHEFVIIAESEKKNGGRIIVIPSSRFVLDRYLGAGSGNLEFVLNVVNELASGGTLSGIRSRSVSFYPLPELAESQKDIFKYVNILLLPFLFSVYGGFRLLKRR